MTVSRCARSFFMLLVLLASTPLAFPQSIWVDRNIDRAIWLEVEKASFTEKYLSTGGYFAPTPKTTLATSNWYLSARWRVSGPLLLRAELPFVNAGLKNQYLFFPVGGFSSRIGSSENQFGNPYMGLELGRAGAYSFGEIGIRFPVVDEKHSFSSEFGTFTDYDRFEAFSPNLWTFTAAAKVELKTKEGLLLHLRAGPTFFLPTKGGADAELFGDYGVQVGYQSNRATVLGGLTGRGWLTENDLGNRFVDQLGLAVNITFGRFIPGLQFRAPVDAALDDIIKFVFGVTLGYRLP